MIYFVTLALFLSCLSTDNVIEGSSPYICQPSGAGIMATCQEK